MVLIAASACWACARGVFLIGESSSKQRKRRRHAPQLHGPAGATLRQVAPLAGGRQHFFQNRIGLGGCQAVESVRGVGLAERAFGIGVGAAYIQRMLAFGGEARRPVCR